MLDKIFLAEAALIPIFASRLAELSRSCGGKLRDAGVIEFETNKNSMVLSAIEFQSESGRCEQPQFLERGRYWTRSKAGFAFGGPRDFLKLGLWCFGGPIAYIGYFRDEFVRR